MTQKDSYDGFMRIPEASRFIGVTVRTLRSWISRKVIPAYKPTKRCVLLRRSDLLRAMRKFGV